MNQYPSELLQIARNVVWFKPAEATLNDSVYFLCYLMQYGLTEDVIKVRKFYSDSEFKSALTHAYPGILDKRSWSYWNLKIFHDPNRPMPRRF